jgi:hypothetical protein
MVRARVSNMVRACVCHAVCATVSWCVPHASVHTVHSPHLQVKLGDRPTGAETSGAIRYGNMIKLEHVGTGKFVSVSMHTVFLRASEESEDSWFKILPYSSVSTSDSIKHGPPVATVVQQCNTGPPPVCPSHTCRTPVAHLSHTCRTPVAHLSHARDRPSRRGPAVARALPLCTP